VVWAPGRAQRRRGHARLGREALCGLVAAAAAVVALLLAPAHAVVLAADAAPQPGVAVAELAGVGRLANGCSAVLLAGGRHLLGAAHCHGAVGSTVTFGAGPLAAPGVSARITAVALAPGWAGQAPVHDLAVMTLESPVTAVPGYRLAAAATVQAAPWVLVAGWGAGGTPAAPQPAGTLRWGRNEYDSRLLPFAVHGDRVAMFDFDDGSFGRNTLGLAPGGVSSLGLGADEAMLAGLDSGGPSFVQVPRAGGSPRPAWWPRWLGGPGDAPRPELQIAGIHAGIETTRGSGWGGIGLDTLVAPYAAWIGAVAGDAVVAGPVIGSLTGQLAGPAPHSAGVVRTAIAR
jgi:hypothetical protein